MIAAVTPRNGNGDLPEHGQKQVEAGLAQHQRVVAERDLLRMQLTDLTNEHAALTVQLDSLKSVVNLMESSYSSAKIKMEQEISDYRHQRDAAVAVAAKATAVIENIYIVAHSALEKNDAA